MIALPARVVLATIPAVLPPAVAAVAAGDRDVDCAACTDFDSSLIALLLELSRHAGGEHAVRVHNPPENLRKLANLYGASAVLFAPAA